MAVLISGVVGAGQEAEAQAPDEEWRTITTEHFRVTFPEHLETLGRTAADRSERAWDELEELFIDPPDGLIDVLVTDHTDRSNGFAQVWPTNRIVVFARPPVDLLSLGHLDEWMELVITHELAHIVHLDHVTNPIGRLARSVFGRVSSEWPFFPETGTPRWVIEGLATWYESRLSDAGRVKGTYNEMQIRTAMLEGRFEDIGQASGESPLWPGGNRAYTYGSLFFDFLLDRYGEEKMAAFADAIAGQWIPYRIDAAGRDAFGVSLTDEWKVWREELASDLADLDARLARVAPITEPERLTDEARFALHPSVSPDGRQLAYARSDGRSDIQLALIDLESGEESQLTRTNGLATFSWMPDGRLLVSQLELSGPYESYGDLYLFDLSGDRTRVTHGARLTQPSAAPDGRRALAIQEGGGSNGIAVVDLESGSVSLLVEPNPEVHWAFPRFSPDGRWIAATRWEPEANHDVVVLDARTGELVDEVTSDRALDLSPSWSSDGRWLVWASDRSGILNVLASEIDPSTGAGGQPIMLTNVRTGAAYPSVDPAGSWLYLSGYHVDGWEVERVAFDPRGAPVAGAAVPRFDRSDDDNGEVRGLAEGEVQEYSPGPTLSPSYWEVSYSDPIETPALQTQTLFLRRRELLGFGIGMQTSGRDLVGRHAYVLEGRFRTSGAEFEGGASYSYLGFGNPILSLTAIQGYADGGQQVAGMEQDTLFTLERERSLDATLSFLAPSWRRNLVLSVGIGFDWESRELFNELLRPSTEYTLSRPTSRLVDLSASVNWNSTRSHSFQMGVARGLSLFVLGRRLKDTSLPDSLVSVTGVDRSLAEVRGRVRGAIPLWRLGPARHTLAFRATGGAASGPGAGAGQYRVGGASGQDEPLTGLALFGGSFVFFPVRGYATSTRFGRFAWSATAEYRFPLLMVNRGFRVWPLHFDRVFGSVFFDTGNAWGPSLTPSGFDNSLRTALASVGAEVTTEILGLYDILVRIRGGVAAPLIEGSGVQGYVRVGLPF